jgi:hypothetical protein
MQTNAVWRSTPHDSRFRLGRITEAAFTAFASLGMSVNSSQSNRFPSFARKNGSKNLSGRPNPVPVSRFAMTVLETKLQVRIEEKDCWELD